MIRYLLLLVFLPEYYWLLGHLSKDTFLHNFCVSLSPQKLKTNHEETLYTLFAAGFRLLHAR